MAGVAAALKKLADVDPAHRAAVEQALLDGLKLRLEQTRTALKPERVSVDRMPQDLVREWVAADGRARVEVAPEGDQNDDETMSRFASAVLAVAPEATGLPILIQQSARTVVRAFIEAGALALVSITLTLAPRSAAHQRRAGDARAAAACGRGDAGADGAAGTAAQLRQHHCAAAAARRWRGVQDLLRARLERRGDEPARLVADARRRVQRDDDGDRLRQPMAVQSSRNVEHGQALEPVARHHARRGRAVSADPDGTAPATARKRNERRPPSIGGQAATSRRSRRKRKNSTPSRKRRFIISGLRTISPTMAAIFGARK